MGDPPRSQTVDFYGILGIPKSASLKDVSKAYKSLVTKWHPDKNPSNKDEAQVQLQQINEAFKGNTTPIVYSQSTAWRIPSPIERKLACTLEELCHGCVKKIKITRDIISNGIIKQVEEILKIKVKPGWKKGTKITFEGKGDERPGYLPADIIFLIDEKRHPLFTREGDDLEYGLEIPLVQALTGCSISVPLLGGEKMRLSFDEIIFPRFEKVIPGQGMPTKREGHRGDLRIKFFVEFPLQLSDEQRSEASRILQDCS
ncbi:heat shock protein binding protein, putative [Ricinus communis]|uniref:Heat shock protein binding protein, putative n=1 Tax=Ricinus communis TaxID=3988 RepID=B9SU73_RICCO|nr:heat shock protein binding protein, putative [Ricinus communis]